MSLMLADQGDVAICDFPLQHRDALAEGVANTFIWNLDGIW